MQQLQEMILELETQASLQLNDTVQELTSQLICYQQQNSAAKCLYRKYKFMMVHRHANSCNAPPPPPPPPSTPSGYFWVRASNGSAVHVYCDMTRSFGNITGGWMRAVQLDMTNISQHCPSGLRQRTDSNIRTVKSHLVLALQPILILNRWNIL